MHLSTNLVSSMLVFRLKHGKKGRRCADHKTFETNGDMLSIQMLRDNEKQINHYRKQAMTKLDEACQWYDCP
jgi:hypothetical protein